MSTRAFGFFLAFERQGRIDVDELLRGLPITRAQAANGQQRIPWDLWAEICDRFGEKMGSPQEIEASGAGALDPGYLGPLGIAVGMFTDARDLYNVGLRWFAPRMYPDLRFSFDAGNGASAPLALTVEIPGGLRGSLAYMQMFAGGLRAAPRLLGAADAEVVADITARRGHFVVTVPPARTARSLVSRAWAGLRGGKALIEELSDQQRELAASYAALARAERGFRSVLEALPVAVGVHRAGHLMYANPALAHLTGSQPGQLLGRHILTLVHEGDRPVLEKALARPDPEAVIELRLLRAPAPIFVQCGVHEGFVFDGEPAALFFAIDLTPSRAAQLALARSEEITRVVFKVLPDLVIRVDRHGTLLDFRAGPGHPNIDVLRTLLGQPVLGFAEMLPDLPRKIIETGIERVLEALRTGRETPYLVHSAALGTNGIYDCRIFPEGADEVVVLARNITEQRRMEEQLAIAERMATLGTVAAGVAHELNNPLTFVVSNVALAIEELEEAQRSGKSPDLAALLDGLRDARAGGERVQRVVKDLRVFSRGGSADERRPTDVAEVIESVIAMTTYDVRSRARMRVQRESSVLVDADPSRLGQVFVNLVMNALQAIPEGAPLAHEIVLRMSVSADGWQEVSVTDDGPGIPAEIRGQIFQPFKSTKMRSGGTGLGLAICHRIVTEHGGTIEVESAEGRGATFTVRLPPCGPRREPVSPAPVAPAPGRRAAILVVDDEPLVARSVKRMLGAHDVIVAHSGEEALDALRTRPFDLVVCDITLGGMSGIDVREALRQHNPTMADRFLFLSGGALTEAARALMARESDRCLAKPITPAELRRRVAEMLDGA